MTKFKGEIKKNWKKYIEKRGLKKKNLPLELSMWSKLEQIDNLGQNLAEEIFHLAVREGEYENLRIERRLSPNIYQLKLGNGNYHFYNTLVALIITTIAKKMFCGS